MSDNLNIVRVLPPFREGANFPPAAEGDVGHWGRAPASLKALGQSLKVDDDYTLSSQATIIRAIPDPWAQARSFADAVLDPDHSMHDAAIGQWRGLLALFALSDLRKADYSLDFATFDLGDDHPLDRVLRHLAPSSAIDGEKNLWLQPHIIYLHPRGEKPVPVAMLNPASLVAPGRTSWKLPFDFIPWMKKGLGDPLALAGSEALSNAQLAVLESYLVNLRSSIPAGPSDRYANAIREALAEYARDASRIAGQSTLAASVRRAADASLPPLYRSILTPAELEEPADPAAVSESQVRIIEPSQIAPIRGFILVDHALTATLGKHARDILVWGNHSLSELLESPHILDDVRQRAMEQGWVVITADDLFTKRLVRLRKDPRIPGHSTEMRDILEPITPLTLLLDQEATRRLEAEIGSRRASATMHLKLAGANAGQTVALRRNYDVDGDHGSRFVPEADWDYGQTSIWPNFRSRNWPYYFARLTYPTTREQIRPQYALSRSIMVDTITSCTTPQQAIIALKAINEGGAPTGGSERFTRFQHVSGRAYEELQTSDSPFDAVFYVDFHPDRGEAPAGCVRLKMLEPSERDNKVSVAIDFGSTNSVACLDGTNGRPVTLEGRVLHPIQFQNPSDNDRWQHIVRWNYVDFLPLADRHTPTPTVVISRSDADRNANLWLYRNLIYFQPAGSHAQEGAAEEIRNLESYLKRSKFDLKWSEEEDSLQASADFLTQFMTMVAAEAAANEYNPARIEWHFSVPDAMQGSRLTSFHRQADDARKILSPDGKLHNLYSEGLAAARYILSGRAGAGFTPGTINAILDIGGSTTDITLWANEELVWKGSFRLAGRAFFTEAIVNNPQLLREIELGDWADLIDPDKDDRVSQDSLADVGELLFSRPALSEAFEKHWNMRLDLKPGEGLRSTALVFLSGMAWYLGIVAKRLVADGIIQPEDLSRPAFALCGRGAGIFRRMHGAQAAEAESEVTKALNVFADAVGFDQIARPQLFISPQPKLEVAAGMMVDFSRIDARHGGSKPKSTDLPSALRVELASDQVIEEDVSIEQEHSQSRAKGTNLKGLTSFLKSLEDNVGIEIDLKPHAGQGAFNEIDTVVRQRVDRQRSETGELKLMEPPFISALSALVSIMASPQTERDSRLILDIER